MKTRLLISLLFLALSQAISAEDRVIAMTGNSSIKVSPDQITIYFSVAERNKDSAAPAKKTVDRISSESVAALIALGVSEEEITSSSFNVYREDELDQIGRIVGTFFSVSRDVSVELSDIGLHNQVIQALVNSGVTEIHMGSPSSSNFEKIKQEAVAAAAIDAKERAQHLAEVLGAKVGQVHQIGHRKLRTSDGSWERVLVTGSRFKPFFYEFSPADIEVSASVYVEFELE